MDIIKNLLGYSPQQKSQQSLVPSQFCDETYKYLGKRVGKVTSCYYTDENGKIQTKFIIDHKHSQKRDDEKKFDEHILDIIFPMKNELLDESTLDNGCINYKYSFLIHINIEDILKYVGNKLDNCKVFGDIKIYIPTEGNISFRDHEKFKTTLKQCFRKHNPQIMNDIIMLYLQFDDNKAHENLLIIDYKHKKIRRYEPHGASTQIGDINQYNNLDEFLKMNIMKNIGKEFSYQKMAEYCPMIGEQTHQLFTRTERVGTLCAYFSFVMLVLVLIFGVDNVDQNFYSGEYGDKMYVAIITSIYKMFDYFVEDTRIKFVGNNFLPTEDEEKCAEYMKYIKGYIEKGWNINREHNGKLPINAAIVTKDDKLLKLLIDNKADVNIKDNTGNVPIISTIITKDNILLKLLIDNKANVNIKNNTGDAPLHVATRFKYKRVVDILLEKKADVNTQNNEGDTPLHITSNLMINNIHDNVIMKLLEAKANPNIKNKKGITPLYVASTYRAKDNIKFLLDAKGDINIKNNKNESPLDFAKREKLERLELFLLNRSPLHDLITNKNIKNIGKILETVDINKKDNAGDTPLHIATRDKYDTGVDILLEKKADVNIQNYKGDTPLHIAARNKYDTGVNILLEKKAGVNIQNYKGNTPLHIASHYKYSYGIEKLIDNGADVYIENNKSRTPHNMVILSEKKGDISTKLLLSLSGHT